MIKQHKVMGLICFAILIQSVGCSKKDSAQLASGIQFSQNYSSDNSLDILLVVSNSPSMSMQQSRVAAEAKNLVTAMNKAGLDWHLAITTADMSSSGNGGGFLGTPTLLTPANTNADQLIFDTVMGLGKGSEIEKGIDSARTVLNPYAMKYTNPGFLRPYASLILVFIGDSDDLSSSSPGDFALSLFELKSPATNGNSNWKAHYYGVLDDKDPCYKNQFPAFGTQYQELVKVSAGLSLPLCQAHLTEFFDVPQL